MFNGASSGRACPFQRPHEPIDHSSDFLCIGDEDLSVVRLDQIQARAELELRFEFTTGRMRRPKVLDIERRRVSTEAFGDVRRQRDRRLAQLVSHDHLLTLRQPLGYSIAALSQIHGLLPDEQIAE